jgi:Arc/MetJ-type ribon-helix-helix transcriptional regulator
MKLSVSLPDEDVRMLDEYAKARGLDSRSAAVHVAIRLLRDASLADDYAAAWQEWESTPGRELWELTSADGL